MNKYNLEFLEKKLGPFQKDYKYPTKPISGFNLIYIETKTKKELDESVINVKEEINPGYIWGYVKESDAVYVTRAFGENKIFIYNPKAIKKTDYVKGKLKVLENLSEDKISDLFDQKAVFDYFYRKLWYLRLDLGKEIRDKNNISDNSAIMAAQHMIDRIIFTYFICEKGLVTLNGEKPIDSKTLFNSLSKMPDPWKCLKNLFFEQFAKKNSNPLFLGKNVRIVTPYLNGGLFRPKTIEKTSEIDLTIEYTKDQWKTLFEPLNKYSWIIEDEIPEHEGEYEGNLTPEIIGHIYEKFVITMETLEEIKIEELQISKKGDLKKGNKKIGAYYTPENITDYISRNTIQHRLNTKLGISEDINFNDFLGKSSPNTLNKILKILNEMTICDPACGSGAFLIKTGEILLEYKIAILKLLKIKNINRYQIKKDIIINNLYGVDIQEGAVEICKLRLWLWLISSAINKKVEPLPNIEYNFTVGNSLVGWTNEKLEQSVLLKIDGMVLTVLDALKLHYKDNIIDEIKQKLQKTDMQSYAESMSLLKKIYSYSTEDEAEMLKEIIESIRKLIYNEINRIFYDYISKRTKVSREEFLNYEPLHWNVDFNEVLKNGGFDLIIGNPPYVRSEVLIKSREYFKNFEVFSGNADLYTYFMEKGMNLLQKNGVFSYIMPNKWIRAVYGEALRNYLIQFQINEIIDFGDLPVFQDVTTYPCIINITNKKPENEIRIVNVTNLNFDNLKNYVNVNYFLINVSSLEKEGWVLVNSNVRTLLNKLHHNSIHLDEYVDGKAHYGIKTGYNKAFVIDEKTKDDLIHEDPKNGEIIRPIARGRDIKRWMIDLKQFYVIIVGYGKGANLKNEYPSIYRYLIQFQENLKKRGQVRNGQHHWLELDNNPSEEYLNKFKKPKIMYLVFQVKPLFAFDEKGTFANNAVWIIPKNDKYLLGILNSKLGWFMISNYCAKIRGGYQLMFKYFGKIPIRKVDLTNLDDFKIYDNIINLVDEILNLYKDPNSTNMAQIDAIQEKINIEAYNLYGLDSNEIKIVEKSVEWK